MVYQAIPPFFQLGHRVVVRVAYGADVREISGEVMDTEDGWLAIRADGDDQATWFNLRYLVSIVMQGTRTVAAPPPSR